MAYEWLEFVQHVASSSDAASYLAVGAGGAAASKVLDLFRARKTAHLEEVRSTYHALDARYQTLLDAQLAQINALTRQNEAQAAELEELREEISSLRDEVLSLKRTTRGATG
jgi:predicted RNase H-like nuclease (RuvC/YqgF family)